MYRKSKTASEKVRIICQTQGKDVISQSICFFMFYVIII